MNREDSSGEFWNIAVGALIGGTISVASSYISARITGETFTAADGIAAFVTGAVSGGLAATGIGVNASTLINGVVTFGGSVGADIASGRKIDWGKAATATLCSVVSSRWSGNGLRHSSEPYSKALNNVDAAEKTWQAAAKGAARKTAKNALRSARRSAATIYLDQSYALLGKTIVSGGGTSAALSSYTSIRRLFI